MTRATTPHQKILVIGSGGREHALCWKLAQSPLVDRVYCAPGNGGTATTDKTQNVPISASDFPALVAFAKDQGIALTVVGPDNALADGVVDAFHAEGLSIFGPTQAAARLESSKAFSKEFMETHHLPTARFAVFDNPTEAYAYCAQHTWARVIKVDGLALGKGVYVCDTLEQCQEALQEIFEANRFGASGQRVVVEERLHGPEVSLMVLSDGQTLIPLASSQDFKRRFDGNQGPNTGGMGSYSPVPNYSVWEDRVAKQVLTPLAEALRQADFTFKGLLYVGLMMVNDAPYILEFNARFGDPETQCLLPRLESDIVPLFWACVDGTLDQHEVIWHANAAVCVVLTADTYPQQGSSGEPITMPTQWPDDVIVFHAGTALNQDNSLVTQGGRILNVVGVGPSLPEATSIAYGAVDQIHFTGMACRTDIAKDVALCLSK